MSFEQLLSVAIYDFYGDDTGLLVKGEAHSDVDAWRSQYARRSRTGMPRHCDKLNKQRYGFTATSASTDVAVISTYYVHTYA